MWEKVKFYIARFPNIPKTILFNFYYLPFKQAIHFPVFVKGNLKIKSLGKRDALVVKTYKRGFVGLCTSSGPYQLGYGKKGYWDIGKNAKVIFEGKCALAVGTKIAVGENATLVFGDSVSMNTGCLIVANKEINFGQDCMIGWNCTFMDTDSHIIRDMVSNQFNEPQSVKLGNHVWIGANSILLKGAKMGDNSVVAANAVLSKDYGMETNVVVAGNPAVIVKKNIKWSRDLY